MSPTRSLLNVNELANPDQLVQLGDVLAEGTNSLVHRGIHTESGDAVAIKMIDLTEEKHVEIEEEMRVLRNMSGDRRIPKYYGTFKNKDSEGQELVWMVMELCEGGTASGLVQRMKAAGVKMDEDVLAYIMLNVVQVMAHLHRNHFVHRDIRGSNIVFTKSGDVKLIDFGTTVHLKSTMDRCRIAIGTPYWMAPEVICCDHQSDADYDNRSDVWSTGVTTIELYESLPPLWDVPPVQAMFQIAKNPPPTLQKSAQCSQTLVDFLNECLERDMESRPVMDEIVKHPFLTEVADNLDQMKTKLASLIQRFPPDNASTATNKPCITAKGGFLKESRRGELCEILSDDIVTLDAPSLSKCVDILSKRFRQGSTYTYVADVLIAINSNQKDAPVIGKKKHEQYTRKARPDNTAHILSVVDKAHQDAVHNKLSQSIVLTGETGSGKSYNADLALAHLAHVGRGDHIGRKMVAANSVLNLLCTSSTFASANSTRCVRLNEVTFTKTGRLSGAIFNVFMLDKHLLTDTPRNEGTFNALYAYYHGLSQSGRLGIYKLNESQEYRLLPEHRHLDTVAAGERFREFEEQLDLLDISKDCQETLRKIFTAIIQLAELKFSDEDGGGVSIKNSTIVVAVAFLLSIDDKRLQFALLNRSVVVDGEPVTRARSVADCERCRDSVIKLLYCRLVDTLVNMVNANFTITRLVFGEPYSVNMVDMFGFTSRTNNSLSQLIANSFNEQIACYFNQNVFEWEMDDYITNGVDMPRFEYSKNSTTIDMLMKRDCGLFALLDFVSLSEDSSDDNFLSQCQENLSGERFSAEKNTFNIAHFMGKVTYNVLDIVNKNKENVSADFYETMRVSANPVVAHMFTVPLTKTGNLTMDKEKAQQDAGNKVKNKEDKRSRGHNKRFDTRTRGRLSQSSLRLLTASNCYRYTAMEVLHRLVNSSPHFVRCVSSNSDAAVDCWNEGLVQNQLKSMQLLNLINIRKHGYSQRMSFGEFLRRYQFLAFDFDESVDVTADNCRLLLVRLKLSGYLIGQDRIFLKYFTEEYMSRLYEREVRKIAKIQASVRAYLVRKRKSAGRTLNVVSSPSRLHAVNLIQSYFRRWRCKSLFQQLQLYRVQKHHELVTFSHQVHIYGQELYQYTQRNSASVAAGTLTELAEHQEAAREAVRKLSLKSTNKLPLSLRLINVINTDHMLRSTSDHAYINNRTAERVAKSPVLCSRCAAPVDTATSDDKSPQGSVISSSTQLFGPPASPEQQPSPSGSVSSRHCHFLPQERTESKDTASESDTECRRDSDSESHEDVDFDMPYHSIPIVREQKVLFDKNSNKSDCSFGTGSSGARHGAIRHGGQSMKGENANRSSYNRFAGSSNSTPYLTSSFNYGRLANPDPRMTSSLVSEMHSLGARTDPSDVTDSGIEEPPFNFQGLLRKTSLKRDSLKRYMCRELHRASKNTPPASLLMKPCKSACNRPPIFGYKFKKSKESEQCPIIDDFVEPVITFEGEAVDL